jgi:outer membrane lipoprotein-sorting protein
MGYKMKKLTLLVIIAFLSGVLVNAQDAALIINEARNRNNVESISTRSRMIITARDGSTSERVFDQYSKDGPNGSRMIVVFQQPANVAGTRFLNMKNASGGEDRWIYLPSLGRVRRVAASESGGSFMGTDFSYDDMSFMDRDVNLDIHTLLHEEIFNGTMCYVIQSIPNDNNNPYSKTITWIDKVNNLIQKVEMYNRRAELVKIMEMIGYRDVQGHMTPIQTRMTTVTTGTATAIFMDIVKYNDPIPEGVFTTQFLETGRVR